MSKKDILRPPQTERESVRNRFNFTPPEQPITARQALSRIDLNRDYVLLLMPRELLSDEPTVTAYIRKTPDGYECRELYPGEIFTDSNNHPLRYNGKGMVP